MGFDYVHSAVDDHSRLTYSDIHLDEEVATWRSLLRPCYRPDHGCFVSRAPAGPEIAGRVLRAVDPMEEPSGNSPDHAAFIRTRP